MFVAADLFMLIRQLSFPAPFRSRHSWDPPDTPRTAPGAESRIAHRGRSLPPDRFPFPAATVGCPAREHIQSYGGGPPFPALVLGMPGARTSASLPHNRFRRASVR